MSTALTSVQNFNFVFEQDTSVSTAVDVGALRLFFLEMPAGFQGTSVAFLGSADGDGWTPIYDDEGNAVTAVVAPDRCVALDKVAGKLAAFRFLKLVAGTHTAANTQTAKRTVVMGGKF